MAGRRRGNGEGSLYLRHDGLWVGQGTVTVTDGSRKRIKVYGRTRQEANDELVKRLERDHAGVRTPKVELTVTQFLDYWLTEVAAPKVRPRTIELYECAIRVHIKPAIGRVKLRRLTVQHVQRLYNSRSTARTATLCQQVLRNALNRAVREELLVRNVASDADAPRHTRKPITPWTGEQAARFLHAARGPLVWRLPTAAHLRHAPR